MDNLTNIVFINICITQEYINHCKKVGSKALHD